MDFNSCVNWDNFPKSSHILYYIPEQLSSYGIPVITQDWGAAEPHVNNKDTIQVNGY